MDSDLEARLHAEDPAIRRKAILELAQSNDHQALELLKQVYTSDPDPSIRALAQQAGRQLFQRTQRQSRPTSRPAIELPSSLPAIEDDVPLRPRKRGLAPSGRPGRIGAYPWLGTLKLAILGLFVVGIVLLPVWLLSSGQHLVLLDELRRDPTVDPNQTFNVSRPANPAPGAHVLQRNPYTEYHIQVPPGEPPSAGWPMLVAVHGSHGSGRDMIAKFGKECRAEGILLVAPSFRSSDGGRTFSYDQTAVGLYHILREVRRAYPVNSRANIAFGYSGGGAMIAWFATDFPDEFDGIVLSGASDFSNPARGTKSRYLIMAGGADGYAERAEDFYNALRRRGYEAELEIIPGIGHVVDSRQVNYTLRFIAEIIAE